jgi:hemerythrin-like domain-containing protein
MSKATENLKYDHVYILCLIDVMEKMVLTISTELSHIELVIHLLKNYVHGFHHAKEENLLFPILEKKGFSGEEGPVSVMIHDHEEGKNYVKAMKEEFTSFRQGDSTSITQLYENMQGYIDLMRVHIARENDVLFHLADRELTEDDQQELLNKFHDVEKTVFGKVQIQKFITEIEGLEVIYK